MMNFLWPPFFLCLVVPFTFSYHDRLHCLPSQDFSSELLSGEFKSPGFPNSYINNLNCVYEIHPLENWGVYLNIEHFETEAMHDVVEIYQTYAYNNEMYSTKHIILSGTDPTQTQFFSQINGGLRVVFKSDFSEAKFAGFKMSFQRFHPSNNISYDPCPEIFHMAQSQIKELPSFNWRFTPRSSCIFQINSTESVKLQVNNIKLGIRLEIFEPENYGTFGKSTPFVSYNAYNFNNSSTTGLTSRSGSFVIRVGIGSTFTDLNTAYNISFQQTTSPCQCPPKVIALNETAIDYTSPGWPEDYCDRLRCVTKFMAVSGASVSSDQIQSVLLRFLSFRVEAIHDLFELYSGNRRLKLLTPYDENESRMINYFTFPSASNEVVNFTTDDTITDAGFKLSLKIINRPKKCQCPNESDITSLKGNLSFTVPFECGYMDCFWNLIPPSSEEARYRVVLKIWHENIGSWGEFLQIIPDRQSEPVSSPTTIHASVPLSDETRPDQSLSMHTEALLTIWYHRETDEKRVFLRPVNRKINIKYSWEERCLCGQIDLIATDQWNELSSPDFPGPYCDGMDCTYTITAPEGYVVAANVTLLDLEFNMDFLFFFDGHTTNNSKIGAYTGIEYGEDPVETTTNIMTVCFTSDSSVSGKGYQLVYKAKKLKQDHESGGGLGILKIFVLLVLLTTVVVGGIYVFRRYQIHGELSLPSFPSFQLNTFESQRFTSSLNSLIRTNRDLDT